MKFEKKWHLWAFIAAVMLAAVSWLIAFYYWGLLPQTIPTHFGLSGKPDAWNDKSVWYTFLLPALQSIMTGVFAFLYVRPQYSDMPTTLLLMSMEKKKREHAFVLIRSMLVTVLIFVGLLFTYMTYMMQVSALDEKIGPNPWVMAVIFLALFGWLFFWTFRVYKSTKKIIEEEKK